MTSILNGRTLGLLGAGNMAEALTRGVLRSGALPPSAMMASDISAERRALFQQQLGVSVTESNNEVAAFADIILLCVKPYQVDSVLAQLAVAFQPARHLLVSICAGVTCARMEKSLPAGARVVRVMPNTPMLVGLGASGLCGGTQAAEQDLQTVEALFAGGSLTVRVAEPMIDAVTGLSGSGPAYLFYLVEAMIEAGKAEGFTPEQASALAVRTVLGAAKMLDETKLPPEELRRRVTSPNGTTQAAIEQLDSGQVKAQLAGAVRRAAERSRELGRTS